MSHYARAGINSGTAAAGGVVPKTKASLFNPSVVKHATLYIAFQDRYRLTDNGMAAGGPTALLPIEDRLVVRAIFPVFKKIAKQETGLLIARNIAAIYYTGKTTKTLPDNLDTIQNITTNFSHANRDALRHHTAAVTKYIIDQIYDFDTTGKYGDATTEPKLIERTGLPLEIFNLVWVNISQPQIDAKGTLSNTALTTKINEFVTQYKAVLGVPGAAPGGAKIKRRKSKSPRRRSPGRARSTYHRHPSPGKTRSRRSRSHSRSLSRSRSRSPYRKGKARA